MGIFLQSIRYIMSVFPIAIILERSKMGFGKEISVLDTVTTEQEITHCSSKAQKMFGSEVAVIIWSHLFKINDIVS